ncbi:DNA-directed RNA polymerase III subunit RPC4-like [Carassius auratus]|uniref:DNA-directed RNA polymerase III subunit RPC4-like n=1 Tax=Carassius auratus TaxID=7957 RepID=A0A6P6L2V2_CARAU|nr:DNA-directed RNA polymerase III subunit RPC4-like [Carassius auratus]XP_026078876.1 DNA-directed RNA polymerase III subunit RPC4-like [Carassius auratus]XP_026078877.1 DNA-directed RNA polymerase III subunit RPC4-like [Carassius auratus]XP_026078878.1 DNA-directed RNA polymerase III subunit RPC4-like [Carassius auratus]
MSEHGAGDVDAEASSSASFRTSIALGRGLPGRASLNPPPPGRLTSLRSRDLTLGGYRKKTFVPNVHSVRKTKDGLQEESHTAPKKKRREKEDRQRERRRRDKPLTIQSHSIFEQGPADTYRKLGNWSSSTLSDCDPAPVTKCVKKEKKNTEDDDDEILQKLQRDDFLDDPGLQNDPKQRPIRLPFYQSCSFLSTDAASSFKEETASNNALKSPRDEQTYSVPVRGTLACPPQQPTVGELFHQLSVSDKEDLLFIQLPDTIPGQPKTSSLEKTRKDGKTEDKRSSQIKALDQPDKAAVPMLSDFSEGLIGKLQIRRSGKVQLVMGNVTLDVSEGAAFSFLQQLVCVRLSEGLTGDMTVLGNITHKLVCSPDFETLLLEAKLPSDPSSASKS